MDIPKTEIILPVPVLILEDDIIMQERLKRLLVEIGYNPEHFILAQTLKQAMLFLKEQPIALALVDLALPDGNGISFIETLRQKDLETPILVLSSYSTQEVILETIKQGATGYFLKERDDLEIIFSIRSVLRGGAPIDPFIAQQILNKLSFTTVEKPAQPVTNHLLSKRELEILNFVAQGMSNREIADALYLSKYTIECHIKHIYRKLSVSNRLKAIHSAQALGIIN